VNASTARTDRVSPAAPAWRAGAAMLLLLAGSEAKAAADCTVSAVGVNFGVYDPYITTPDDSVGQITVTCNHLSGSAIEVRYTVTLSTGGSGSYAPRQLRSGPGVLGYNLSSDLARAVIWGNGSAGTVIVTGALKVGPGAGNGSRSAVHYLYGRIPALQDAAEGDYVDSIVATLTY
jgi:spore coat protein U-like protein